MMFGRFVADLYIQICNMFIPEIHDASCDIRAFYYPIISNQNKIGALHFRWHVICHMFFTRYTFVMMRVVCCLLRVVCVVLCIMSYTMRSTCLLCSVVYVVYSVLYVM